jgi:hypothetical protein
MERTVMKIRHVALLAKPVPKSSHCERLPKFSDKKRQMTAGGRINDRTQVSVDRDLQIEGGRALRFLPCPMQHFELDMLRSHRDHIVGLLPVIMYLPSLVAWFGSYAPLPPDSWDWTAQRGAYLCRVR